MKHAKGFTLIELMIVTAVIAILAGIGIPAYGDYVKRGKLVEATTQLSDGRVKFEQFFQDNRTYVGGPCPDTTKYFTLACANTASTYTLTAASKANQGLGATGDYTYTINETNVKTSATPWGNGASCWVMKKGDAC